MELKRFLDYILDNYLLDENSKFSSEMGYYKVIVNYIPSIISEHLINKEKYKVYGSCGKGSKSAAPYIAVMYSDITTTPQKGIYIDLTFKSDMSGFYLALDQGLSNIVEKYGGKVAPVIAKTVADYFRSNIQVPDGFEVEAPSDSKINTREEGYEKTRIISKFYKKDEYSDAELQKDFDILLDIYNDIIKAIANSTYDEIIDKIFDNSWESVYKEIAQKVLDYKDNHKALVDLMYEILIEMGVFRDDDENNCNLDSYNGKRCRYDDIDPFSFMNRLDIYKNENRRKFIELFQKKTGLMNRIPDNFDGIPSVNPQRSCFIEFKNENREKDVNDYWNLFETAINYSRNQSIELSEKFINYYNECVKKPGCSFNITMGLFRIDPNFYINLDSTNRQFIRKEFGIDIQNCPDGKQYLEITQLIKEKILESGKFKSLRDFSDNAWKSKKNYNIDYWTYSPGENASEWDDCLDNNIMVIGWDLLGHLNEYDSKDKINEAIKKFYNKENPYNDVACVYDFVHSIKPGDVIIAKAGQTKLLGYGIVEDNIYKYDDSRKRYKNCRNVKWIKKGLWSVNPDSRMAQKTLTNITQYEGFSEKLMKIMEGDNIMNRFENEWIMPANPKYYNHSGSFEKNGYIDWNQNVNFKINDIVYIYSASPDSRITAKTIVDKIDLTKEEKTDDREFNLTNTLLEKENNSNRFVRLKLLETINDERLSYDELAKHGLWGRPQRAAHLNEELSNYIHYVLDGQDYNDIEPLKSTNEIYYGGPGCGKSKLVEDKYCKGDNFVRTTFYPDYTNSDFVGQLAPYYNKEKEKLEYKINPGYFTKAYEKALLNPNKNIYLIIEEINRGNAAAIFGDIFQLLDRVTDISVPEQDNKIIGESEYEISNNIIETYILDSCGIDLKGKIKIPANLSIIATMNTSDQNVYTLDSAFKRRWKMIHISNDFGESDYDIKLGSKFVPMLNCSITWKDYVDRINNAIINIDSFGINSEDKQIGKYFVGTSDLLDSDVSEYDNIEAASKVFAEKVLMYLWEDIAKLKPSEWFKEDIKTLDSLIDKYQKNGINVFSENIISILNPDIDGNLDE